jgi:hypothetical protein
MRASREASNALRGASQMLAQQIKSSLETTKVLGVLQDRVTVFVSRELFRIAECSIFIKKPRKCTV